MPPVGAPGSAAWLRSVPGRSVTVPLLFLCSFAAGLQPDERHNSAHRSAARRGGPCRLEYRGWLGPRQSRSISRRIARADRFIALAFDRADFRFLEAHIGFEKFRAKPFPRRFIGLQQFQRLSQEPGKLAMPGTCRCSSVIFQMLIAGGASASCLCGCHRGPRAQSRRAPCKGWRSHRSPGTPH